MRSQLHWALRTSEIPCPHTHVEPPPLCPPPPRRKFWITADRADKAAKGNFGLFSEGNSIIPVIHPPYCTSAPGFLTKCRVQYGGGMVLELAEMSLDLSLQKERKPADGPEGLCPWSSAGALRMHTISKPKT